jgi:hypothetical protein
MAQNAYRLTNNHGGECRKAERQEVFRVWLSAISWTATAVFWKFILLQRGGNAGRIQAAAAALWVIYGVAIHSAPVLVANLIVGIAAVYTSLRLALKGKAAADAKTAN